MARRSSSHTRSRKVEAKKARRRKRRAARDATWLPPEALAATTDLEAVDATLTARGWQFDIDNSTDELATWFFEPSGLVTDDETVETVTRIWLTVDEEWHVILVGAGADGVDHVFSAESLLENLDVIEAYRATDPTPTFQ